jgi:hypothetical protein
MDNDERKIFHEIEEDLRSIAQTLKKFLQENELNTTLVLTIPSNIGDTAMGNPVSETVAGGPVQAVVVEGTVSGPGTTFNGPISFVSDSPAVATVSSTGLVTPVSSTALGTGGAAGVATITASDAIGSLSDSVVVTVTGGAAGLNTTLTLSIPANAASSRRF